MYFGKDKLPDFGQKIYSSQNCGFSRQCHEKNTKKIVKYKIYRDK